MSRPAKCLSMLPKQSGRDTVATARLFSIKDHAIGKQTTARDLWRAVGQETGRGRGERGRVASASH